MNFKIHAILTNNIASDLVNGNKSQYQETFLKLFKINSA